MKRIGQTFNDELIAAGLVGLPITWDSDNGVINFHEDMKQSDIDAVNAVYDAHDPDHADFIFAKQTAINDIRLYASGLRKKLTDNADAAKLAGWTNKAGRAERINSGTATAAEVAIVQKESDKRGKGETVEELAAKQLAKADKLANAISVIDGMEDAAIDAVNDVAIDTVQKVMDLVTALKSQAETEAAALLAS